MKLIARQQYISQLKKYQDTPDIKILSGIRRCGKSQLLVDFAEDIRATDPMANIIVIDFNNLHFEPLKEYHALHQYVEDHYVAGVKNYLMIDEVQLCPHFELAINSLHSQRRFDIFITGSNAFLMNNDLATLFTGRQMQIDVYPFSFSEFLQYYVSDQTLTTAQLHDWLERYVVEGGFAGAYVYARAADRQKYVQQVFNTIVDRDIIPKFKISMPTPLLNMSHFMMDNVGNIVSSNSMSKQMATNFQNISAATVAKYISYLIYAFVFYKASRYDIKGKKYLETLDKYYLADTSLRLAVLGKKGIDWGRMYENIVYIELLRRGYEVFVGKLYNKEVDFVAQRNNAKVYIQVSDNISDPNTLARELQPLQQIADAYPKMLLANTLHADYDIEGIAVVDLSHWLTRGCS